MAYGFDNRYIRPPIDEDMEQRVARLRELGIGELPDAQFDEYARLAAERTGAAIGFVNFIGRHRQYTAGMHNGLESSNDEPPDHESRCFGHDVGFCVYVVERKHALILEDLRNFPRFHSNVAVSMGYQSYMGAPLMDSTGIALGTIAVVDMQPRRWGRPGLKLMKAMATELMELIKERAKNELDIWV